MKGFELNEEEINQMTLILQEELENYIGTFDGEIYRRDSSIVIQFEDDKYIDNEAVIRKIENFFQDSQFNRDEFTIDNECKYSIDICFNN